MTIVQEPFKKSGAAHGTCSRSSRKYLVASIGVHDLSVGPVACLEPSLPFSPIRGRVAGGAARTRPGRAR